VGQPVVHFEIIGRDPAGLRRYYGELFGWEFDTGGPVAPSVSGAGEYGFTEAGRAADASGIPGIPGGVGGGEGHAPHVVFYVGVPDVPAALRKAESLGGRRAMGPERSPGTDLVVAHFTDPEGNLVGLAGTG
jgi:predicted enzyme related to lactoylglutathione lyase